MWVFANSHPFVFSFIVLVLTLGVCVTVGDITNCINRKP